METRRDQTAPTPRAEGTGNGDETSLPLEPAAEKRSATFCSAEWAQVLNGRRPAKICQLGERSLPKLRQPAHLQPAQRTSNEQWRREASTILHSPKLDSASNWTVPFQVRIARGFNVGAAATGVPFFTGAVGLFFSK